MNGWSGHSMDRGKSARPIAIVKRVVYLVEYGHWDESYTVGAFSTRKKASDYIKTMYGGSSRYGVVVMEVK